MKIRKLTDIITAIILIAFILYLAISWKKIPEVVATHYNFAGEANAYGNKKSLIAVATVAVLLCSMLAMTEYFPQLWNLPVKITEENKERLIRDGIMMIAPLKVILALLFCYLGICAIKGLSLSIPMYLLLILVAVDILIGIFKIIKDR